MIKIPFDISISFDGDLHDIPNNAVEMQQALIFLQSQLRDNEIEAKQQIQLLGLIGSYARILQDFVVAQQALMLAIELSEQLGEIRLRTANQIRLAHVYQWQQNYKGSEALFEAIIENCQHDPSLISYLDFAYQHMGKCKFDQQQYEAAQSYFERALLLRRSKGDQSLLDSTQLSIDIVNHRLNASK
jgi:tetratricopeptide (TPR) repeat protein